MPRITNHDLHVMLARVEEKLDAVKDWQKEHQENDSRQFEAHSRQFITLNKNIGSMNRFGASIAIVASVIGATGTYIWQKLTSKI